MDNMNINSEKAAVRPVKITDYYSAIFEDGHVLDKGCIDRESLSRIEGYGLDWKYITDDNSLISNVTDDIIFDFKKAKSGYKPLDKRPDALNTAGIDLPSNLVSFINDGGVVLEKIKVLDHSLLMETDSYEESCVLQLILSSLGRVYGTKERSEYHDYMIDTNKVSETGVSIMNKKCFQSYCQWWIPIVSDCIDHSEKPLTKRDIDFILLRLQDYYFRSKNKTFKIKELLVIKDVSKTEYNDYQKAESGSKLKQHIRYALLSGGYKIWRRSKHLAISVYTRVIDKIGDKNSNDLTPSVASESEMSSLAHKSKNSSL